MNYKEKKNFLYKPSKVFRKIYQSYVLFKIKQLVLRPNTKKDKILNKNFRLINYNKINKINYSIVQFVFKIMKNFLSNSQKLPKNTLY